MNIENNTSDTQLTVGQLLSQARESMGLSQETIAERLCLKVAIVRAIDEDSKPAGVEPTFLRGYMRLYARLVNLPEQQILALLNKDNPIQEAKVSPMQSYSLGKKRKKREGWLMKLTWVIFIILIAMVGVWWWQDHQAQKQEFVSMAEQNEKIISQQDNEKSQTVEHNESTTPSSPFDSLSQGAASSNVASEETSDTSTQAAVTQPETIRTVPLPGSQVTPAPIDRSQINNETAEPAAVVKNDTLNLNFTGDCWLDIRDANKKVLFSGTKKRGDTLNLTGKLPYQVTLGAPANVQVQFQGKNIDLSRFVKASRAAKLKIPEA
ncbi:cytoskeleton protein RodZ [Moellerella wisconsensis]|uniref:cytoskeleton protein RodZ n=1 Tax=Moellerella wisconsensis TaxID=158849 RepID=UPI000641534F|nr:cytoskeleton protein RodZ [Moellerella wisconsensis]KLN96805.1 membrane protein [Moellerella wisconsensis]UNH41452.1 cytoskeleton protein RodZ [Moellerella wisconsensis]